MSMCMLTLLHVLVCVCSMDDRLLALPEIEREAILFERFSNRQRRRERMDLKRKLRAERSSRLHEASTLESKYMCIRQMQMWESN